MTTTMIFLNEGQKMIYGRKRIMDTFYKVHPVGKESWRMRSERSPSMMTTFYLM